MPEVIFTSNLQQHVSCETQQGAGTNVREVLDSVFQKNPQLQGYILDDQKRLRQHMVIFIDGATIVDRVHLQGHVSPDTKIYVMQALSGG